MPATNAGRDLVSAMIIGEATTDCNNANATISVGDSTTAFAVTQTDLQASTNKARKAMNATYPSRSTNVLTFQATFLEADAVFHWQEWGIHNASSSGVMISRIVQDLGIKPNTEQWRMTATLTVGV